MEALGLIGIRISILILAMIVCCGASSAGLVEVQLISRIDESRGFCIDIRGHKERAKIQKGLQVHTCYSYQGIIGVDQGFDEDAIKQGLFFMPAFDVCMEVEGNFENAKLMLKNCTGERFQKTRLTRKNQIKPVGENAFCVAASKDNSKQGGGGSPPHLIRTLTLQDCAKIKSRYVSWRFHTIK